MTQPEEWKRDAEEIALKLHKKYRDLSIESIADPLWTAQNWTAKLFGIALRQTAERAAEREREKIKQLIDAARAVDLWHSKQEKSDLYLSAEFMQLYKALHEICSGQP